jgi:broad specificity phosphatase PhoE
VEPKKEYVSFKVYIKNRIENYFEEYARERVFWSDPNTYNYRESFHRVEKKIEEVINKYFERVEKDIE